MKLSTPLFVSLAILTSAGATGRQQEDVQNHRELDTWNRYFYWGNPNISARWRVTMTNLAYRQPMGPAFVAVHNSVAPAVFQVGTPSGDGLEDLAEGGSPATLVSEYAGRSSVFSVVGEGGSGPIGIGMEAGVSRSFEVTTTTRYPLISLATMLINTNDCFAGFNSIVPSNGLVMYSPGYDSGTEVNDEDCNNIPGPACEGFTQEGTNFGQDGEGIIHIHRGVHGIGDLAADVYDWRNPVMRVEIVRV